MKKLLYLCLIGSLCLFFASCTEKESASSSPLKAISQQDIKVGFVYFYPPSKSTYIMAHDRARTTLAKELGVETVVGPLAIGKDQTIASIEHLVEEGCNVIYAVSDTHAQGIVEAAKNHPDIYFGHASGNIHSDNLSTYRGKNFEARYLTGVVAGMNTKTNRIGYVASMPIPEVIRGINAFALGVQSMNKNAKIEVMWLNTWEDHQKEKQLAKDLAQNGADIITQHTDTIMPQLGAYESGAYSVSYNDPSVKDLLPNNYLTGILVNWSTFYIDDVQSIIEGRWKSRSYFEGIDKGMVELDDVNTSIVKNGTAHEVGLLERKFSRDDLMVFTGPIYDNKGKLQIREGKVATVDDLFSMNYFVENVVDNLQK